jgi:hypothetical protein
LISLKFESGFSIPHKFVFPGPDTMTTFDLSDVPPVEDRLLKRLVELMAANGRSRILFKGATREDRDVLEDAFWAEYRGETAVGVAALVRFWAMIEVVGTRRLGERLLREGFLILRPLARASARLRMNVKWGFNPQRMLWMLDQLSEPALVRSLPRRRAAQPAVFQVRDRGIGAALAA